MAINTPWGCYKWTIMPQGLENSPATWQSMINKVLGDLIGTICFAYVDDVIVFGAYTIQDHLNRCIKVIEHLEKAGLLINPNKSTLFAEKVKMLGHYISEKGIEPNNDKVTQIVQWKTPTSKQEVQRFMDIVNWIRKFIPMLGPISKPLTQLTRKSIPFKWLPIHNDAFERIKGLAKVTPILKPLDYKSGVPVWVVCDASKTGIGAAVKAGLLA